MAGLIPTISSVVNELVSSAVTDEAKSSGLGMVKEHVGYFLGRDENVEKMKKEVEKLKTMRRAVGQQIIGAKRKRDELLDGVQHWVDEVDADISKAEEFLIPDVNRYSCGKRAALMSLSLMEHQVRGKGYETCVSVDIPPPGPLDMYQNKNLDDIFTHNSCLGDIIKAIEDESKQIIGIYGQGGVGKTTLAMEVSARVKNRFDTVAFTTLSQTVSVEKIKKDLEVARKGIDQGEKVLVILDDVWKILDLKDLCIPCGTKYKNCKILLTSRSEFVCEGMNAYKICVNALPKEEAWIFFKRIVGDVNADLQQVAEEVAEKCGGLPLLLKAVGNALKTKSIQDWIEARKRLREPAPSLRSRYPEIGDAFDCLELSYNFLKEEAQLCFLLCCLFPEDEKILLETLVYYVVGLAKFCGLESIDDARWRVRLAVEILTSSGLLLKLEDERYTKMHDVVRDVARIIASVGENNFLVKAGKGLTEWLPRNELKSYTGISLMRNKIPKLPNYDLDLPHLEIFLASYNCNMTTFSSKLFQGMQEVKVLDMGYCNQSLLRGFQFLTKLRVLNLMENKYVVDISIFGVMKDLEILILNNTGINEIPEEIGKLVNLRRLEVLACQYLNRVAKDVISKLSRLEELRIELTWLGNEIDDRKVVVKNYIVEVKECIVEVMKLSKLTHLDLVLPDDVIPEGFDFGKLKRFGIQIGGFGHWSSHLDCRLAIVAVDVGTSLLEWTKKLIPKRPATILSYIENIKNIMPDLSSGGFNEFEHIELISCPNVSSLVDEADGEGKKNGKCFGKLKHLVLRYLFSLEALWNCSDQYVSLSNLVTLYISKCNKLERLFSVSVAKGLGNLQNLSIVDCENFKEVIWDGDDRINEAEIVFPSLTKITLLRLNKLERFSGHSSIKYPSLVDVSIMSCPSMKTWGLGPGRHEAPKLKFVGKMPLDGPDATINDIVRKIARNG